MTLKYYLMYSGNHDDYPICLYHLWVSNQIYQLQKQYIYRYIELNIHKYFIKNRKRYYFFCKVKWEIYVILPKDLFTLWSVLFEETWTSSSFVRSIIVESLVVELQSIWEEEKFVDSRLDESTAETNIKK